tara:strand:+ start:6871 stop:7212 length:342 start_codon:yes stop_codon:yes gene_type:complete
LFYQILTGILRHYAMTLLQTTPKKQDLPKIRQQRSLVRGVNLRTNANVLSPSSFAARKAPGRPGVEGQAETESYERPGCHGGHDGHDEGKHGYDDTAELDYGMDQCLLFGLRD